MQLGQWVEFETIVVKGRGINGTQPLPKRLAVAKRGMIVGMRPVYDACAGTPPLLSNRQMVLMVATSLHTTYRVFPGDALPTAAPAPKRVRARRRVRVAQTVSASPAADADAGADRSPPTTTELELWVADELNDRMIKGDWFTAYDITLALRTRYSHDDIAHDLVREVVHTQMANVVSSGLYTSEGASFGNAVAVRYVPA